MSAVPEFVSPSTAHEQAEYSLSLSELDKALLNNFQHGFPICKAPFRRIAEEFEISEDEVLARYQRFQKLGFISRIGPVIRANTLGASTLAAMAVAEDQLESIAAMVSDYAEVNHNYEREHDYNLWFVVTANDEAHLAEVLSLIEQETGHRVLNLPLLEAFHIDLGFEVQWNS